MFSVFCWTVRLCGLEGRNQRLRSYKTIDVLPLFGTENRDLYKTSLLFSLSLILSLCPSLRCEAYESVIGTNTKASLLVLNRCRQRGTGGLPLVTVP